MSHEMVQSVRLEPGDHMVGWGAGWIVAKDPEYVGTGDIGSSAFRHREVVTFVHVDTLEVRKLPVTAETRTPVIRGWAEANGVAVPEVT